jgi:hypothetical protein
MTVTANVVGIFEFEIHDPGNPLGNVALDFGDVDTSGTIDPGSNITGLSVTVDDTAGSATYAASGVKEWAARSAPMREVTIEFTSNNATGGMAASQLELRIPVGTLNVPTPAMAFGSPASAGFLPAGGGNNLLTGLPVGNGNRRRSGTIDIELTVQPDDVPGAQTFDLLLTASGT